MKTSELDGELLDRWVARAQGWSLHSVDGVHWHWVTLVDGDPKGTPHSSLEAYHPLRNWAQGGPVLDHGSIFVFGGNEDRNPRAGYTLRTDTDGRYSIEGEMEHFTYLGAGLKAFVHQRFGPTVDDNPDWSSAPDFSYQPFFFG